MFDLKINPDDYDYVMYVDASGDDGFQFDNGSSVCYAAAALLVQQSDIQHNLAILSEIKSIVGCKPTDEVKYSKVRRHRRSAEALQKLAGIKGRMSCHITFKKELPPEEMPRPGQKSLSVICHFMALRSLDSYFFSDGSHVLVAIDRMKSTEEKPVERLLTSGILSDERNPERNFTTDVIFRDSKDANFLLIQIADLLCGIVREHFEQYEYNKEMLYFKRKCTPCARLLAVRNKKVRGMVSVHPMCSNGKKVAHKILHSNNLHFIFHLIPEPGEINMLYYLFVRPEKLMDQHFYMVCNTKK